MSEASETPIARKVLARVPISVRWRDMDAYGHVNNAKYISYLEEARVRWLHGVTSGQTMGRGISPVVANTDVNYRRPIVWPNDIVVELFVERVGNSSVTIGHRIVADNDDTVLYSDGHVVVVWIDTATGKSAPIPEAVRQASV
ncbi:thioesterase family protein [Pseudoxanthomonas winnipegensis]|uniref:acyl-CoA thioesterase n=1 Tax=Pseudoxanthomonas winnipegensis TaxID=2480810 RepID=UPI0030F42748